MAASATIAPRLEVSGEQARHRRARQLSQPGVIAAFVAGIGLGGVAGATFKGSGMFFSNLILGGVLLALLVFVGLGSMAAAAMHRTGVARTWPCSRARR